MPLDLTQVADATPESIEILIGEYPESAVEIFEAYINDGKHTIGDTIILCPVFKDELFEVYVQETYNGLADCQSRAFVRGEDSELTVPPGYIYVGKSLYLPGLVTTIRRRWNLGRDTDAIDYWLGELEAFRR